MVNMDLAEKAKGRSLERYRCFICGVESDEKGLPLLICRTTYSNVCLGQRLQEILSEKFLVLIKNNDSVCWDCAEVVNWIDKYEMKVEIAKDELLNQLLKKYKKVEVNITNDIQQDDYTEDLLTEPEPDFYDDHLNDYKDPPYIPKNKARPQVAASANTKKKKYPCSICNKLYTTAAAAGAHAAKVHRFNYECEVCNDVFETQKKYKTHMMLAHESKQKPLTCVSCGFQTTNTEIYCRHICNSSFMSVTCTICSKRFVNSSKIQSENYRCEDCKKVEKVQEVVEIFQPSEQEEIQHEKFIDEIVGEKEFRFLNDENKEYQNISFLKCTNCNEEFELSKLASHQCFVSDEVIQFSEVERQVHVMGSDFEVKRKRRALKIPAQENTSFTAPEAKMMCKTCKVEFKTIGLMRQHWEMTGHLKEVSTTTHELNKIRDKTRKTEQTFKVVKQNFHIKANVPGQNDQDLKKTEDVCIYKFQDDISVEEFIGMRGGKACETCGIMFGSEELLNEHQTNNCLTCITCNVTFFDNKLLKKHYDYTGHANRIKTQEPQFKQQDSFGCHICFKPFFSRFVLGKHLQKHYKGTSKGVCYYCQMEFDDKTQIQQHTLEVHGAQLYKCQHCDRTFLSENTRNKHELKHNKNFKCKYCKTNFKTQRQMMLHIDHNHRKSLACLICGKEASNFIRLKRHEKLHFYTKTLKCDLCRKTFRNKTSLMEHSKIHENDVKIDCKTCGLGFKNKKNLEEHQIVHLKSKFMCQKCNVVCPSRTFYWMHLKMHEPSYRCNVCKRTFRDTSLLAVHRRRKHWHARAYQCPHCPRVFSVSATLRRHMTKHTRAFPHRCVLCKRGFLTRYAFHRHLDVVHTIRKISREKKYVSLPLNATDEDIFQAADTLIANDTILFDEYSHKDNTIEHVPSSDLTTEVIVENTELFDVL